jgi:hypothetical protein
MFYYRDPYNVSYIDVSKEDIQEHQIYISEKPIINIKCTHHKNLLLLNEDGAIYNISFKDPIKQIDGCVDFDEGDSMHMISYVTPKCMGVFDCRSKFRDVEFECDSPTVLKRLKEFSYIVCNSKFELVYDIRNYSKPATLIPLMCDGTIDTIELCDDMYKDVSLLLSYKYSTSSVSEIPEYDIPLTLSSQPQSKENCIYSINNSLDYYTANSRVHGIYNTSHISDEARLRGAQILCIGKEYYVYLCDNLGNLCRQVITSNFEKIKCPCNKIDIILQYERQLLVPAKPTAIYSPLKRLNADFDDTDILPEEKPKDQIIFDEEVIPKYLYANANALLNQLIPNIAPIIKPTQQEENSHIISRSDLVMLTPQKNSQDTSKTTRAPIITKNLIENMLLDWDKEANNNV